MNQYLLERATLYITELNNSRAAQSVESSVEELVNQPRRSRARRSWLFSVLAFAVRQQRNQGKGNRVPFGKEAWPR